jgi:hypothetical protein
MKSCTKPTNISDKKRAHFLVSSGSNWGMIYKQAKKLLSKCKMLLI